LAAATTKLWKGGDRTASAANYAGNRSQRRADWLAMFGSERISSQPRRLCYFGTKIDVSNMSALLIVAEAGTDFGRRRAR
jgi:hypothetical protein